MLFKTKISKTHTFIGFGFILIICLWKFANPLNPNTPFVAQPPVNVSEPDLIQKIDAFFEVGAQTLGFSGFVLVSQNEKVWGKGYGRIAPDLEKVPSSSSPFRIGSVTKPLTAFAILNADSKTKLSIHDPVCKYLSCFCKPSKKSILISDFLNHTSGLPHDFDSIISRLKYTTYYQFQPKSESTHFWDQEICDSQIDESKHGYPNYSNLGYLALGRILENIEQRDLNSILKDTVFSTFQMSDSSVDVTDNVAGTASGMKARQALISKQIYFEKDTEISYSSLGGAGAGISTAKDLLKFLKALESRQILPLFNWDFYLGNIQQGEASIWANETTGNHKTIRWHNGSTAGFYSFIATVPEARTHIIVLSNIQRRSSSDIQKFFAEINSLVSEKNYQMPVR